MSSTSETNGQLPDVDVLVKRAGRADTELNNLCQYDTCRTVALAHQSDETISPIVDHIESLLERIFRFQDTGGRASRMSGDRAESMDKILVKIWRVLRDSPEVREPLMADSRGRKMKGLRGGATINWSREADIHHFMPRLG